MNGRVTGKGRIRLKAEVCAKFENGGGIASVKYFTKYVFVRGKNLEDFDLESLRLKIKKRYGLDAFVICVIDPKKYRSSRYVF